MEWLEKAGWVYDNESDSLERVSFQNPLFAIFGIGILMSILAIEIWEIFLLDGFDGFSRLIGMLLIIAVYVLIVYLLVILYADKGEVIRIGLTDLNYTTMNRSKRTLKNSNLKILESEKEFTHENLEVIVVSTRYADDVSYDVRLVRKDIIGNEKMFTYHPTQLGDNKGTLPAELQVPKLDLIQNKNIGSGHHLQRYFCTKYSMSEYGASELSKHLRELFIDGGWEQLSRNSNLSESIESPKPTNGVFWESSP